MNRIPCKKCPQCGLFNDFTIKECECGKTLNSIEARFIDTDKLFPEQRGEIDTSLKVYVQKCAACGALNYTDSPDHRVKMCYNCHKTRVAAVVPIECVKDNSKEVQNMSALKICEPDAASSLNAQQIRGQTLRNQQSDIAEEDEYCTQWKGVFEKIQKIVGDASKVSQVKSDQQQPEGQNGIQIPSDTDNDEEYEEGDWSNILVTILEPNNATMSRQQVATTSIPKDITLSAIGYGCLSFTVKTGQDAYMLGRSAKQGSFLSQDGRVGNEHCYLFYRNGAWFVKDNNSRNGTAVNSRDIGLNVC